MSKSPAQQARSWWRGMTFARRRQLFPTIPCHLAWHFLTADQRQLIKEAVHV